MEARVQAWNRHAGTAGRHRVSRRPAGVEAGRGLALADRRIILLANWPYTFIGVMPTNKSLMATDPAHAGPQSRRLIEKWAMLHGVRAGFGLAATAIFLWASLS